MNLNWFKKTIGSECVHVPNETACRITWNALYAIVYLMQWNIRFLLRKESIPILWHWIHLYWSTLFFFSTCTHKLFTHSCEDVKWFQSESDVLPVTVHITAWFNIIPRKKVIEAAVKYCVCWWRRGGWRWNWYVKLVSIVTYKTTNAQSGNFSGKKKKLTECTTHSKGFFCTDADGTTGLGQADWRSFVKEICSKME